TFIRLPPIRLPIKAAEGRTRAFAARAERANGCQANSQRSFRPHQRTDDVSVVTTEALSDLARALENTNPLGRSTRKQPKGCAPAAMRPRQLSCRTQLISDQKNRLLNEMRLLITD